MDFNRQAIFTLIAALSLGLAGCKKSESTQGATVKMGEAHSSDFSRVHWLGKKRMASGTNATVFMQLWNLPESQALEAQTIDKLSTAPWRLLKDETNAASSALLRPIIEDLVDEESFVEIHHPTNGSGEMVLAIRLSAAQAGLWETNLAAVAESLTGIRPTAAPSGKKGWSFKKPDAPQVVELTRVGDWTVLGAGQEGNGLLSNLVARLQRGNAPFAVGPTNFWLAADLDLLKITKAFSLSWSLPAEMPQLALTVTGDGREVRTRGELNFAKALSMDLESWNIPTNLIHDPLVSFTAMRGIKAAVSASPFWQNHQLGEAPNQFYLWGLLNTPYQTYFAAPVADASNRVYELGERAADVGTAWLLTNGVGKVEKMPGGGFRWVGLPFIMPRLQASPQGDFVHGGLFPDVQTNQPAPQELLIQVQNQTNLVYYDWETTSLRLHAWSSLGQILRLSFRQARMSGTAPGMAWALAIRSQLGNCGTAVTLTKPDQLTFVRNSTVGFTAFELHLLADWLESPEFPRGLHTILSPPDITLPH